MTTDPRLTEMSSIAAASMDTKPADRFADIAKAISAGEREIAELHKASHAVAVRMNKLIDVRKRLKDLYAFPPGSKGGIPDHARKLAVANDDLRALSITF